MSERRTMTLICGHEIDISDVPVGVTFSVTCTQCQPSEPVTSGREPLRIKTTRCDWCGRAKQPGVNFVEGGAESNRLRICEGCVDEAHALAHPATPKRAAPVEPDDRSAFDREHGIGDAVDCPACGQLARREWAETVGTRLRSLNPATSESPVICGTCCGAVPSGTRVVFHVTGGIQTQEGVLLAAYGDAGRLKVALTALDEIRQLPVDYTNPEAYVRRVREIALNGAGTESPQIGKDKASDR